MAHRDSCASRGFEVNVVDTDREIADGDDMWQRCDSCGVEAIRDHAEDRVRAGEPSHQFIVDRWKIVIPQFDSRCLGQAAQRRLCDRAGYEDPSRSLH
jgi:hypothetical protein